MAMAIARQTNCINITVPKGAGNSSLRYVTKTRKHTLPENQPRSARLHIVHAVSGVTNGGFGDAMVEDDEDLSLPFERTSALSLFLDSADSVSNV